VGYPAAIPLTARLSKRPTGQLPKQLHHYDHGVGHSEDDGDDHLGADGAVARWIAEGLVATEEAAPEGTPHLVEQHTGHAEGHPDQQVAEPAGQLRILGHDWDSRIARTADRLLTRLDRLANSA